MTALIVRWLLQLLPNDELVVDGEPYMRRYYLAGFAPLIACRRCDGTGGVLGADGEITADSCVLCDGTGIIDRAWWWRWSIGAVRVHEIVASDDQRAFHDHPWDFISIGLRGSYIEERPAFREVDDDGATVSCDLPGYARNARSSYRAPWLIRRHAEDLHALDVVNGPVWTLVVMGPKRRSWGFAGPFGWIHWRDFDDLGDVR